MTVGKGKRPRDPNPLAKWIVDQSTSDAPAQEPQLEPADISAPANISAYMASIGRKGGKIGGKRRLKTMTVEERRGIARKAAKIRWKKHSKKKA